MTITAWDVRQATLEEADDITELTFACKDAEDLGIITSFTSLCRLNAAFNKLASLPQLTALDQLRHLDVSHNLLLNLQPVSALTLLTCLNASANKIRSLAPLGLLPQLQHLLLHGNQLSQPAEVLLLSRLVALESLTLRDNPMCHTDSWQMATIAMLPCLRSLDELVVDAHTCLAAAGLPESSSWQQAAADANALPDATTTSSTTSNSGRSAANDGISTSTGGHLQRPSSSRCRQARQAGNDSMSIKDATLLLPDIRAGPLKPSTLLRKNDVPPQPSIYGYSRAKPTTCIHIQRYSAAHAVPTAAVSVRSDGSATCSWPEGGLAVSLDLEAATSSKAAYRLLAMYRGASCVAASFDSTSGFVQYPSGALMLVWSRKDGSGTAYGPDGSITHSFNSRKRALTLRQDLTVQLDQFFKVTLLACCSDLHLDFSCEGCHLAVSLQHGAMLADRLADDATVTSATTPGKLATAAEQSSAGVAAAEAGGASIAAADDLAALMARARLLMATSNSDAAEQAPGG